MRFISFDLMRTVYNKSVRRYLPKKIAMFNGVGVKDIKLFDATDSFPEYEKELIFSIRDVVATGDSVVIVGGGRGVSTVVSARIVGKNGDVITYEASNEQVELVRETVRINQTDDCVTVNHTLVGNGISIWGTHNKANQIECENIPPCDVLVLDCEGTEKQIIRQIENLPRDIIVETHGHYDSPTTLIKELVKEKGYKIKLASKMDTKKDMCVIIASKE